MATIAVDIPRRQAILWLSEERGRTKPLHESLISKWAADLGFDPYQRSFTPQQWEALRFVNRHYAQGGTRKELLQQLKQTRNAANGCS